MSARLSENGIILFRVWTTLIITLNGEQKVKSPYCSDTFEAFQNLILDFTLSLSEKKSTKAFNNHKHHNKGHHKHKLSER